VYFCSIKIYFLPSLKESQKKLNNGQQLYTSVLNKPNTIQPILYNLFKTVPSCFYDITKGQSGSHKAREGFDSASGLGSVVVNNIIDKL
jgi:hypothetical protein